MGKFCIDRNENDKIEKTKERGETIRWKIKLFYPATIV